MLLIDLCHPQKVYFFFGVVIEYKGKTQDTALLKALVDLRKRRLN